MLKKCAFVSGFFFLLVTTFAGETKLISVCQCVCPGLVTIPALAAMWWTRQGKGLLLM